MENKDIKFYRWGKVFVIQIKLHGSEVVEFYLPKKDINKLKKKIKKIIKEM